MAAVGYKTFNKDLIDENGIEFEVGIKHDTFNNDRYIIGFRFNINLEDSLENFGNLEEDVCIAQVFTDGNLRRPEKIAYTDNDYIITDELEIIKILKREAVIEYGLNLSGERLQKFINNFRLTNEEIKMFCWKYPGNVDFRKYIKECQKKFNKPYVKKLPKRRG